MQSLAGYGTSSSSTSSDTEASGSSAPATKRPRCGSSPQRPEHKPSLPPPFAEQVAIGEPDPVSDAQQAAASTPDAGPVEQATGRVRTFDHVEGQWALSVHVQGE